MDVSQLTPAELVDGMGQALAGMGKLHRLFLRLAAEYERREAFRDDGATSMTAWIAGMFGQGHDTASEGARVAQALETLPQISADYDEGWLSWDQVRALTQFADAQTDEHFAREARKFSAGQLRRMARRFKPVRVNEENENYDAREFRMRWDVKHGVLKMSGQLPAAEGRVVEKAFDRFLQKRKGPDARAGTRYDVDVARADALVALCSTTIAADSSADRASVGVYVDASVLTGGKGMCELDNTSAICMETAQRMACDSRWYIVVQGPGGIPIGIGRTSRSVPPWLEREVRKRDGGCRFPGCGRKLWTNIHHKIPWYEGGQTDLPNLIQLCGFHHKFLHEGRWKMDGDPAEELTFISPDGRVFREGPTPLRESVGRRIEAAIAREPRALSRPLELETAAGPAP